MSNLSLEVGNFLPERTIFPHLGHIFAPKGLQFVIKDKFGQSEL